MLIQLLEDFPMIEVSIPSMEREVDESGKSKKRFRVEVLFNGRKHYVLRRNSEFQTLHRKLRKIIQTPDFPSKRNPHLRTKPLEQRRQELEDYIQVKHPGVRPIGGGGGGSMSDTRSLCPSGNRGLTTRQ
uniref:PX domain-containing protein n=1 Tax=Seriola dumerili TaxID=41447 RepID=A0A3B4VQ93_SERDU